MWSIKSWVREQLVTSIKRRTLFVVMLLFTMTSLVIVVVGMLLANHEVKELFDARLAQQARLLVTFSEHRLKDNTISNEPPLVVSKQGTDQSVGHKYESKIFYQVWVNDHLLIASDDMQLKEVNNYPFGYGEAVGLGYEWRTFHLKQTSGNQNISVVVAERSDVRGEIANQIAIQTLLPEIIAWPLVAILVWLAVGFGLDPIKQLTQRIKTLSPSKLESIEMPFVPEELSPVQNALNRLLEEIDDLIGREKRWIADAAHELRTPLSILRVHAENAVSAVDDVERSQSLYQLTNGVDRSTRIVSQLLALARLEHHKVEREIMSLDVLKVTRSMMADMLPLAWQRNMDVELHADDSLRWFCRIELNHLEILLQNLLSNSIKFSSDGGQIDVFCSQTDSTIELMVADHGQGVSEEQKARLSERFYRSGEAAGAGLGLAIVMGVMEQCDGKLSYEDTPGGGLTVKVVLPKRLSD